MNAIFQGTFVIALDNTVFRNSYDTQQQILIQTLRINDNTSLTLDIFHASQKCL